MKMFYATRINRSKVFVSCALVIYYDSLFYCVYVRVVTEMEVQFINFKNRTFYEDMSWRQFQLDRDIQLVVTC